MEKPSSTLSSEVQSQVSDIKESHEATFMKLESNPKPKKLKPSEMLTQFVQMIDQIYKTQKVKPSPIPQIPLTASSTPDQIDAFIINNKEVIANSCRILDKRVKRVHTNSVASKDAYDRLNGALSRIEKALKSVECLKDRHFELNVFGSVVNGFWTDESDVDLSLTLDKTDSIYPVFCL
eukprot:TRINITY_DN2201_c0_g1_i2.p3 TRINITY_DN2201_c0_g1~~TRINITY_DN2201_c0_g1_i2.p3  ORF type:complete len:179 (+),score=21.94 TRINITY_DN2201_c0_g1_i2:178-714(+)